MNAEFTNTEICKRCKAVNSFKVQRTVRMEGQVRRYKKCAKCGLNKVVITRTPPFK